MCVMNEGCEKQCRCWDKDGVYWCEVGRGWWVVQRSVIVEGGYDIGMV